MKCSACDGKGHFSALVYFTSGCEVRDTACTRCIGVGHIPAAIVDWLERGEAMRQNRIDRHVSLGEEARHRGMSPVELSNMEHGYSEPLPNFDPNPVRYSD